MRNIIKLISVFCILIFNSLYAQITVKGAIDHIDPFFPYGIDTLGNISLTVSGSTSPYTYKWIPGNSTIKDKTAAVKDSYTVRIKDNSGDSVFYYYNLGYKTNWINCYGTKLRRDSLMETGSISGNVTAVTKNTLLGNTDGWLQFVVPDFTYPYLIGFLDSSSVASQSVHDDVDFAFHLTWGNTLYAWSNGYFTWLGYANAGDVMRIERIGSTYYLKKNNVTIHSASTLSYRRLKVKALLDTQPLANIGVSFKDTNSIIKLQNVLATIDHIKPDGKDSLGNIRLSSVGGDPAFTYTWTPDSTHLQDLINAKRNSYTVKIKDHSGDSIVKNYKLGYKVKWTDLYGSGTTFIQDTLHADAASSSTGLSSAASVNELRPNIDGWAQYIVQDFGSPYVVGFSDSIVASYHGTINDMNCAFHISYGSNLYSWYSGYWNWLGTVTSGDIITLLRGGSSYYIKKNNDTVFTGSANATRNLKLKCTINDNYYLANIGVSFSDSTSSRPLSAKAYIDHIALSGGDTLGNIKPNISGGVTPYTFKWLPGNIATSEKLDTRKDSYTLKVKDFHGDSVMYYYNLGYKTDWYSFYGSGTHFINDTLFADHASTPWGSSTALSKNELRPYTNGWIQMILPEFSSPFVFGLLDSASTASIGSHDDFDFAFHETYGSNLYAWNGSYFTWLGTGKAGDVIKIERNSTAFGATFYLKRNNATIYSSSAIASKRLKIKAEINDDFYLANIGASFTPSLTVEYRKTSIANEDEPNSAYIFLTPKNGIPPYRYLWNNSSTGNALADLGTGTYSVIVTDSLRDTVRLTFTIGKDVKFSRLNNMAVSNKGYLKNSYEKPSIANTNHFIPANTDGFFEFRIKDTLTNFNFLFREIDTTLDEQPQPITIVKTRTVHLAWASLPTRGTSDYNEINFTDTVTTRDSAWVIQKEFFNDSCKFSASCSRLSLSGIHFDYGSLYILNAGYTIKKGIKLDQDIMLKMSLEGSNYKVYQNNSLIKSFSLSHSNPVIGDLILNGPTATFDDVNGSISLLPLNTVLCRNPADNTRNWEQITGYDELGNTVSETKHYIDNLGRLTQTQTRNLSENNIIATEAMYDAYGRQVGQTLPAPINQQCFGYKTNFLSNLSHTPYTYNDFDVPNYTANQSSISSGEVDNPHWVDYTQWGTLGYYYSNNNVLEKYVPVSSTPFTRIHYSTVDPSMILKTSMVGDKLKSGSGHESYTFRMAAGGEVPYMFGAGLGWRVDQINNYYSTDPCANLIKPLPLFDPSSLVLKSINVDQNGVENISFTDLTGNMLGSCLAGQVNGANVKTQTVKTWLSFLDETKRYVDIHLPDGCATSLAIEYPYGYPSSSNCPVFNIIDLKTGLLKKFGSPATADYKYTTHGALSLPSGYYRIYVKSFATGQTGVNIINDLNYYNFSLNYYDYANRLKAVVSPNSFDDSYVYTAQPGFQSERTGLHNISSISNQPLNFPVGTTWSLDSTAFVNTKTLDLSSIVPSTQHNYILNFTFNGKALPAIGPEANNANTTDSRVTYSTTAWNSYTDQNYIIDTTQIGSELDSLQCTVKNIYFKVKIGILDSRDSIIEGTVQESSDLKCVVQHCISGDYEFWSPANFSYSNYLENETRDTTALEWKKIKILTLEPIYPTYGDTFVDYASLTNRILLSSGIVEIVGHSKPNHKLSDRYRYNSWSEILNNINVDKGQTDYVYTKDGKIRFTQNSKQDASNSNINFREFSFIDYDNNDRPVLTGAYDPTAMLTAYFQSYEEYAANPSSYSPWVSVHLLTDNYGIFPVGPFEAVNSKYDTYDPNFWAETGLSSINYIQHHLVDKISYSYNDQKKTWYSYDEQGRLDWVVQKYYNVGTTGTSNQNVVKTFNYKYDPQGHVSELAYNKESTTDRFYHYYEYDMDQNLKRVYTSRNGVTKAPQAKYDYYLHGSLKRTEIANRMQATDYVYTINGWLKSMNGPEMAKEYDPGKDGYLNNSLTNSDYKDIFGMSLEYYLDDYERAGTYIQSYNNTANANVLAAPDLFNGMIRGQRWQTRYLYSSLGLQYDNTQLMFGYLYDKKYQLKESNFTTVTSNGTQNYPSGYTGSSSGLVTYANNDYRTYDITYDNNGNILTLKRDGYYTSTSGLNMDNLVYHYNNCTNKLNYVTDGVTSNAYSNFGFKYGQSSNNYQFNSLGEQTLNTNDNKRYEYNSSGNVIAIRDISFNLVATYEYDEQGNRIKKTIYLPGNVIKNTLYVRDCEGQIVATFDKTGSNNSTNYSTPSEWNVYGDKRVGILDNTGGTENYIYELDDHLGNVRSTFKRKNKTTISTNFNGGGNDDNWFVDNGTLDNTLTGSLNNGYSIKTLYPNIYGAGTKLIPVKYGDNLTITYNSYHQLFPTPPAAGMVFQITDAAGNILPGGWYYSNLVAPSGSWHSNTTNLSIVLNYPDMYLAVYPWNQTTNSVAYFDDINIAFNTGAVDEPDQLSTAAYYPHGSVMPGTDHVSSFNYKYGYQGQFAEKDEESNENFFELRNYDPLLGRFNTIDPANQYHSPYMAMGNSQPNKIDKNGDIAATWAGALIGAGVGMAGYLIHDLTSDGQHKIDKPWYNYAAWTGAGFIGGGILGGLSETLKPGHLMGYDGVQFFNKKFIRQRYRVEKGNFLGWKIKNIPLTKLDNLPIHFSFGIRVNNWVLFDLRFNSDNDNNFQTNFPGRSSTTSQSSSWRLSLPYFVWRKNPGHYKYFSREHITHFGPFCFYGGYSWFLEHTDGGETNSTHHK